MKERGIDGWADRQTGLLVPSLDSVRNSDFTPMSSDLTSSCLDSSFSLD